MAFDNMDKVGKEYTNGEITVVWKPRLCDHSAVCISELPSVFDSIKRPWIIMTGAPSKDIMDVVDRCPTQALSWYLNVQKPIDKEEKKTESNTQVKIVKDGPILISGDFTIIDENGNNITSGNRASFCVCKKSKRLPFCDGSHRIK
jgi:uncharacterized Fe-S cluster protein YjdI